MQDFTTQREHMVATQIETRGIAAPGVLDAMRAVPREAFVMEAMRERAYDDSPLPIDAGQTISQPYIVALMAEAAELTADSRVLEIGAGSGYAAAILSRIAAEVWSVERHAELADGARRKLAELGYDNVHVRHGDGTLGWPEHRPFDAILVAAGSPEVPPALLEQLDLDGRLVIPVGADPIVQQLMRIQRVAKEDFRRESLGGVRFVPLVGKEGWRA